MVFVDITARGWRRNVLNMGRNRKIFSVQFETPFDTFPLQIGLCKYYVPVASTPYPVMNDSKVTKHA